MLELSIFGIFHSQVLLYLSSFEIIAVGPPAANTPYTETIIITSNAMTPCWKSAITTPQYPEVYTYTAPIAVNISNPTYKSHPKSIAHNFPIAIPTHPRINIFKKTCHPASQPRKSSAPSSPNRKVCHSAWLYASERRNILVETYALIAHHAA